MNRRLVISILVLAGLVLALGPATAQDDVSLLVWADDTRSPVVEEISAAFTEEFGVEVIVQEVGFGDIRDQIKIAGPAGEGPDIFVGAHDWIGELAVNGLLAPIDLGGRADEWLPVSLSAFTWDGELVGLPIQIENVALFRNTDLVPDAPATWDEVAEVSAELVGAGDATYGYVQIQNDAFHFFPVQTAFGGYVFGFDEETGYDTTDLGIDSEGSIAALDWLDSMVANGLTASDSDWGISHELFETGEAAMLISGPWALDRIRESGVPYAISNIPGEGDIEEGQPFLGVQGFMINAFSDNQLLAEAFLLDFIAVDETMQAISDAGNRPSPFVTIFEAIEDPDLLAFGEAGVNALAMPANPEMSAVWGAWGDALTLVQNQEIGAEEAFTNAGEQIRTVLEEGASD